MVKDDCSYTGDGSYAHSVATVAAMSNPELDVSYPHTGASSCSQLSVSSWLSSDLVTSCSNVDGDFGGTRHVSGIAVLNALFIALRSYVDGGITGSTFFSAGSTFVPGLTLARGFWSDPRSHVDGKSFTIFTSSAIYSKRTPYSSSCFSKIKTGSKFSGL